ncbi:hypothetical protein [Anaplasma phagocytophilum]|nr:hypothetical protein [Anaplasma phagocytophilum]
MFAKAVSYATKKPIIAVNHCELSCFRARMRIKKFSFLVLSDGHCQFM